MLKSSSFSETKTTIQAKPNLLSAGTRLILGLWHQGIRGEGTRRTGGLIRDKDSILLELPADLLLDQLQHLQLPNAEDNTTDVAKFSQQCSALNC